VNFNELDKKEFTIYDGKFEYDEGRICQLQFEFEMEI
jgi:hypothetical protein